MKIIGINNYEYHLTVFGQKEKKTINRFLEPKNLGIESAVIGAAAITGVVIAKKNARNKYLKTLANDLSKELKKVIKPSDLKSVITRQEFHKIASSLKEENYIASAENIKNGVFRADFHSHSNFSDGITSVETIMNQAAEYGDKLNKINGKKFLFALSDHDGVEGVKEALKIIAQSPKKFENVRFIPAAELSLPIPCEVGSVKHNKTKNEVEMIEMLIYGINPFSKASDEYFSNLYKNRKECVQDALKLASQKNPDINYLEEEFNKYFTRKKVPYCMLNQHWRIFHYINLKTRIAIAAKELHKNPEDMYWNVMNELPQIGDHNGQTLDTYFKNNNIKNTTKTYTDEAWNIISEISPKFKGPTLWAPYESSYEKILEYAIKEDAVLALAHPGFTLQNMRKENALFQIKNYIDKSKGRLLYSESFHQAYPPTEITQEEINEANKLLNEAGLISIGGRDKHNNNFKF